MQTTPLDIAGGNARWVTDAATGCTSLQWTHPGADPACVPYARLRWSADVLAGDAGAGWARSLPTVVQRYDDERSWIFHASRLQPLHDLPGRPDGRWSVYRWAGEWVVEFHADVAGHGAAMPLIVALTATLGSGPSAIR
jgi:hypothetical protein